jgi:predicted nucleic acid-binding protein
VTTLKGVLDANMVIGLVKGGIFDLLASLYAPLYIPTRVKQEILTGQGRPGEEELARALGAWITEITPDVQGLPPVSASLSLADREVLAVAADPANAIDHILTGDDQLYQEAERSGHTCFSVTDVVVFLKEQQLVPSVRSVLDRMIQNGFGIGSDTYEQTLRIEGEWPAP